MPLSTAAKKKKNGSKAGEGQSLTDIDDLLSLALGCIGMSLYDFCCFTPAEFAAIAKAWRNRQQEWECTHMACLCTLQPYSSKTLGKRDVMKFGWDEEEQPSKTGQAKEQLTTEEIKKRYREALTSCGYIFRQ